MQLIDQHTKGIMEACKVRAREAGLSFDQESLEYVVSNRDMLELSPKVMIPTLYDYWVHDVEVLKGIGKYKLFPYNPYETVINSRPAISFYNDNNPDWLNVMIFYHVLAHIDFFQNNIMFEGTWGDDFVGQALADKRLIAALRSIHGRWVDYAIEFSRNMDNLCGYYPLMGAEDYAGILDPGERLSYFFDQFLPEEVKAPEYEIYKEIEHYNQLIRAQKLVAETQFFGDIRVKYPEFQAKYEKHKERKKTPPLDIMNYVMQYSSYLKKEEHQWMKQVMSVVRNTALYFAPQIRTKILNEGWASYWHDRLFRNDDRLSGHETDYAKANAGVISISRIGLNPYAIGLRLIEYVEELAAHGEMTWVAQKTKHNIIRDMPKANARNGKAAVFSLRSDFNDYTLINTFVDQDFVDMHNLFVVGERINPQRGTIEYYVKSRKAEDYKQMLIDSLYHPPKVTIDTEESNENELYLKHHFEGKQLIKPFIADALTGIGYLWGGMVKLETTEIYLMKDQEREYRPVLYTYENRRISKKNL